MADLEREDLLAASERGLKTAQPQPQGKASKRQSHWVQLRAFFGAAPLENITRDVIIAYRRQRLKGVGAQTVNRDLGVLRSALSLARSRPASGYSLDPFVRLHGLAERGRAPIALSAKQAEKFVRACWAIDAPFGAFVELLFRTASRLNERPYIDGKVLRYPAYKRGLPRAFKLQGRLAELARMERRFSRKLWKRACEVSGITIRPHDLRHTRLSIEGRKPGASLLAIQARGGWRSPAMASRYLHPDAGAMDA